LNNLHKLALYPTTKSFSNPLYVDPCELNIPTEEVWSKLIRISSLPGLALKELLSIKFSKLPSMVEYDAVLTINVASIMFDFPPIVDHCLAFKIYYKK